MISVGDEIWCVREKHSAGEVTRDIVAIGEDSLRILDSASHFYSHLRLSKDSSTLSWVCWEHPQMPWDGTEIKVADIKDGSLVSSRVIAGGLEESCLSPEWGFNGELFYISDHSGWWNLWSIDSSGKKSQIIDDASEWGFPL